MTASTSPKRALTRELILDHAYALARRDGLEGLTIGSLAADVGMSKSGVFAHFGAREDLLLAVLQSGAERFTEAVMRPALREPRGLPRLRATGPGSTPTAACCYRRPANTTAATA